MHYLSSVHFVIQPLHVSDIYVAHHQEVFCIYTTVGTCCVFSRLSVGLVGLEPGQQSTEKHNTYELLYIYRIPPDDGLQICPKHVAVEWRNELRINSASRWFSLHEYFFDTGTILIGLRTDEYFWLLVVNSTYLTGRVMRTACWIIHCNFIHTAVCISELQFFF